MSLPAKQLDLFYTKTEYEDLRDDFIALKESQNRLRKGLFSRLDALSKKVIEQEEQLYALRYKSSGGVNIVNPHVNRDMDRKIPFEIINQ